MDVKAFYLHPKEEKEVYLEQSKGFQNVNKDNKLVCKLKKSKHGLEQAAKNWDQEF